MSQNSLTLPTTGTVSGLQMTQYANNALDTLNTLASGASSPSSPEAGQLWHDTTGNLLKVRSLDNTTWIALAQLNESAYLALPCFTSQITGTLNRIINAAMAIDQVNEGASYTIPTNNTWTYAADQWRVICNSTGGASGVTAQRVADAPVGFSNSLKVTVGTGATVGSADVLELGQVLEGLNVADLAFGGAGAVAVSLSFWVKSSVAGTFSLGLSNAAENRSYITTFTIASAGTWTKILLPDIPGDQSGTWATGNADGLEVFMLLSCGTGGQTGTLSAWQAGFCLAATTQSNSILATSGATFQLTGMMLHPGAFCLPFEKRTIQEEIALCERYFFKTFPMGTAVAQSSGNTGAYSAPQSAAASTATAMPRIPFRVRMRTAPSVTLYNPGASNAQIRNTAASADWSGSSVTLSDESGVGLTGTTPAGTSAGENCLVHITASARM